MSIDRTKTAVEIIKIAQDIYHAFVDREEKKKAEDDAKAKRIRELEAEVERLKGPK